MRRHIASRLLAGVKVRGQISNKPWNSMSEIIWHHPICFKGPNNAEKTWIIQTDSVWATFNTHSCALYLNLTTFFSLWITFQNRMHVKVSLSSQMESRGELSDLGVDVVYHMGWKSAVDRCGEEERVRETFMWLLGDSGFWPSAHSLRSSPFYTRIWGLYSQYNNTEFKLGSCWIKVVHKHVEIMLKCCCH